MVAHSFDQEETVFNESQRRPGTSYFSLYSLNHIEWQRSCNLHSVIRQKGDRIQSQLCLKGSSHGI